MKELKNIKHFIFDLDGTCYVQLEEVFGQVSKKMGEFISKKLNVDLKNLETDTIKMPKLQEQNSMTLIKCLMLPSNDEAIICPEKAKREIITVLNRRFVLPFYIPIVALICSFLLIKSKNKNIFFNKNSIFIFSFIILIYSELIIRYTGISKLISLLFLISPFVLIPFIYFLLIFKLSKEPLHK